MRKLLGWSLSLDSPFDPNVDIVDRWGVECVRQALEQIIGTEDALSCQDCADDDDDDTFVDILSGIKMEVAVD